MIIRPLGQTLLCSLETASPGVGECLSVPGVSICTGRCRPPRRTADATNAAATNNGRRCSAAGGSLCRMTPAIPQVYAYSNPTFLEGKAVEGRKGFHGNTVFIKIKKLILTLGAGGSTVTESPSPNEMSKPRARAEQGPKR